MEHEVALKLHTKVVSNKDVEFDVKADGAKLGTVLISKGNIEWRPAKKSVNKHRLSWTKFAELMKTQGKPAKIRK